MPGVVQPDSCRRLRRARPAHTIVTGREPSSIVRLKARRLRIRQDRDQLAGHDMNSSIDQAPAARQLSNAEFPDIQVAQSQRL